MQFFCSSGAVELSLPVLDLIVSFPTLCPTKSYWLSLDPSSATSTDCEAFLVQMYVTSVFVYASDQEIQHTGNKNLVISNQFSGINMNEKFSWNSELSISNNPKVHLKISLSPQFSLCNGLFPFKWNVLTIFFCLFYTTLFVAIS